jgi:hypothetical protein
MLTYADVLCGMVRYGADGMSCLAVASPNVADILTDVLEKKAEASTVQTPRDAEDTLEGHAESEGVIVGKVEAEAQGCHALGGGGGVR